jgi:hypothetical protein
MCTLTRDEISARDRSFIQICKIEGLSPAECYARGKIYGVDRPSRQLVFKVYLEIKKRTSKGKTRKTYKIRLYSTCTRICY